MMSMKRNLLTLALMIMAVVSSVPAHAATGEMGTGYPSVFGSYSAATGVQTVVWGLSSQSVGFPAGCSYIVLSQATMGVDAYKVAVATLLSSRAMKKTVRFYSHAEHDNGCGVDYVQLND